MMLPGALWSSVISQLGALSSPKRPIKKRKKMKEGRTEGRMDGRKDGRKEGRMEGESNPSELVGARSQPRCDNGLGCKLMT